MHKKDWLTVPNILSYVRIALIPVFIYFYLSADSTIEFYRAAFVLVVSGVTDALDGIIARKLDQITELGKLLDPIADKLTQVAIAATLMIRWPSMWVLVLLFTVKELNMLIHNIWLYRKGIIMDGSKWYGKYATAVFYVCMFTLVIFPNMSDQYIFYLIILTAGFQLIALIGYSGWFIQMHRKAAK